MNIIRTLSLALAISTLALGGCALNPVTGKPDIVLTSESGEISRAKKQHEQITKELSVYKDPELQDYINEIGQKVAKISHRDHLKYTFVVLDSPDFNAFTTGGGYVYMYRGLLTHLKSEEELAAVLGHEIGHITARHGVRQQTSQMGTQVLAVLATIATRSQQVGQLAGLGGTALARGYGREHELEADRLGAEYLYKAGYDPEAMIDVVSVLKDNENYYKQLAKEGGKKPQPYHGLFATHPRNDTRLRQVIAAAGKFEGTSTPASQERFRRIMSGVEYGDSTDSGTVRDNRFYHRGLDFTVAFPKGWKIENTPNAVFGFPQSQQAFVELKLAGDLQGLTPQQFISERLKVTNLTQGQAISQAGLTGYTGIVPAQGKDPAVRLAVIYHKESAFVFRAMNRDGAKTNFDPFFQTVIRSLRPLKKSEYRLATGLKLKYIKAGRNTRYASLARRSPLEDHVEEKLRLLNGDYPRGEPKPGEWIKVVVE